MVYPTHEVLSLSHRKVWQNYVGFYSRGGGLHAVRTYLSGVIYLAKKTIRHGISQNEDKNLYFNTLYQ